MFLCSKDKALFERLQTTFPEKTVTIINRSDLTLAAITKGDTILLIDLDREKKTPLEEFLTALTCPCIALSSMPSYKEAIRVLSYGIRGYGNKYMRPENFRQSASAVQTGQLWMIPSILQDIIQHLTPPRQNEKELLQTDIFWQDVSKREKEVCLNIAQGLSNQEAADKMFISLRTIKAHLTNIYQKTGCRDRLELALKVNQIKMP